MLLKVMAALLERDSSFTQADPFLENRDPRLNTRMVAIRDGKYLVPERSTPGSSQTDTDNSMRKPKRNRFVLKELKTPEEKEKWSRFMESTRMDYIQKGPNPPSVHGERGKSDDTDQLVHINERYVKIFGPDAPMITAKEIEAVYHPFHALTIDETKGAPLHTLFEDVRDAGTYKGIRVY